MENKMLKICGRNESKTEFCWNRHNDISCIEFSDIWKTPNVVIEPYVDTLLTSKFPDIWTF